MVLLLVVIAVGVRVTHGDSALPGTKVAGIDVGGQTEAEIRERLSTELSGERRLLLRADGVDEIIRVSLDAAGYRVDLDATARDAVEAGRGGFLAGVPATLSGLVSSRTSPVDSTVDDAKLRKAIDRVEDEVGRKPYPGSLSVDPDTLDVTTKPSRAGQTVDRERLKVRADRELMAGRLGPIDVPLESVSAVSAERLETLADEARAYVLKPMRFTGAGSPLELTADEVAPLLALQSRDGGRKAVLGVGLKPLRALLDRLEERGNRDPRDARITVPAAEAGVLSDKGDVTWEPRRATVSSGTARSGRTVERGPLATAIREAVAKGDHAIKVPTTTTKPKVTTEGAEKVRWMIGSFTTPYVPGQPRVTNIRKMADTVDGTVIPPGGSFSLNGITGERTKDKGYVEAPFIAGNKIEPSVGGGVSQFSTTVYNAAYFAGLQIDAFRAHSLYIDRYPAGRESTLNFPDIDMRWTNDTDAPVVVRASYDDAGVTVALYGNNGSREVSSSAGDREPVDGGNFQITVTRKVRYDDGREAEQPVTTRYETEVVDEEPDESSESAAGGTSDPPTPEGESAESGE
ncbi:MAG: VanW family protein [Patulibacter sp.]|nr:VanW family protein [Patulibacter sp.]